MVSSGSDATKDEFAPTLRAGEVVAEKYRVEKLLGSGGMAEVYAAVNLLTEKRVALKLILPALSRINEAPTRFRREALAAGRIHHPNVVTIFDAVEHQGSTCLVMELLEGETLAKRLERTPQLPLIEVIALILPAMRGVAAAHEHGVVHRDLKPENIFITLDGEGLARGCKVLDFGVSKLSARAVDAGLDITLAGNLVGTPMYMAPEQVRGSHDVDHRMDIYSIGVVLYEMIAGRPPFTGQVYSALMVQIATTEPPPLSQFRAGVPKRITEIVARALDRNVDRRFPDMLSFIRALEDAARDELHLTVGTPPQGLVTELLAPRPAMPFPTESAVARVTFKSRWVVLGAGIAISMAALMSWRWWRGDAKPSAPIASPPTVSSPQAYATPVPPSAAAGDTASSPTGATSAPTGAVASEVLPARAAMPGPKTAPPERSPGRHGSKSSELGAPAMPDSDGMSPRPDSLKRAAWRPHAEPGHSDVPPDLPVSDSASARVPKNSESHSSPSATRPLRAGKLTVDDF